MSTEKKLLDIISKITTDKTFQDKVIELYEQESPLKKYAWYNEPKKENSMVEQKYSYGQFYDLFDIAYVKAIKSSQEVADEHSVNMRKLKKGTYINHDYAESYDDFFTYGQIYIESKSDHTLYHLYLPYLLGDEESDNETTEYLKSKDIKLNYGNGIRCLLVNHSDGKEAYRTLDEWESIIFNSPLTSCYLEESDELFAQEINEKFNPDWIDRKLSDLTCEIYKKIKSLDQLSKEMPAILTKAYDFLETLVK